MPQFLGIVVLSATGEPSIGTEDVSKVTEARERETFSKSGTETVVPGSNTILQSVVNPQRLLMSSARATIPCVKTTVPPPVTEPEPPMDFRLVVPASCSVALPQTWQCELVGIACACMARSVPDSTRVTPEYVFVP